MSCTVFSLPIALAYIISAVTVSAIGKVAGENMQYNTNDKFELGLNNINDDIQTDLKESVYETAYVDKDLLLKTLSEHGVKNLVEENDEICCTVENFTLVFSKENPSDAYLLKIKCPENSQVEEKINDLNNEYTLNVQEGAYLSIIENLKDNNMSLEKEEVLEDNTIVLTVNIEQ